MSVTSFPKRLTALNAEVTTATISIQAMVIERRQVTLSVFQQLIEEPIFDWKAMALRGVGCGFVNYLVDGSPADVIHLVWQRGNELRRCKVLRRVNWYCWLNGCERWSPGAVLDGDLFEHLFKVGPRGVPPLGKHVGRGDALGERACGEFRGRAGLPGVRVSRTGTAPTVTSPT
jgi:hypothetical protein